MTVHIGATWRIRLNRPCAAAMRPFVKLLLLFASLSIARLDSVRDIKDLTQRPFSVRRWQRGDKDALDIHRCASVATRLYTIRTRGQQRRTSSEVSRNEDTVAWLIMPLLSLPGHSVCRAVVDVSTNCMSIVAPCVPFSQPNVYFRHLWRESPYKEFSPKKIGNITQRCSPYSNVPLPSLSTISQGAEIQNRGSAKHFG